MTTFASVTRVFGIAVTLLLSAAAVSHGAFMFGNSAAADPGNGTGDGLPAAPTFTIDRSPQCNCFRKDNQPFRYISGTMHYFQVPYGYWADRMQKMRAAGLNALQTYISWNMHEPFKGVYDFDEQNNVFEYFDLAKNMSLDVLVRIGPVINAERDNGGLPFWLLNVNPNMRIRTADPSYHAEIKAWYDVLLPRLKPHLYINGGNILTVQIENEYGFHSPCDKKHLQFLYDLTVSHLGSDVVYFTTDNANSTDYMQCGKIADAQVTTDYFIHSDTRQMLDNLRQVEPTGPIVDSEFYPGWIVRWNENYTYISDDEVVGQMETILQYENSSCVNVYPIHGGTNFGFGAGAMHDANRPTYYNAYITSYDYNAPITENGDTTSKYMRIRELTQKYLPKKNLPDVPANITRAAPMYVHLQRCGDLFSNISLLTTLSNAPFVTDGEPQTYEEVLLNYGFALYEHVITEQDLAYGRIGGGDNIKYAESANATLHGPNVHDRAIVFVDGVRKGVFSRISQRLSVVLGPLKVGQKLSLMSENQGRASFGTDSDVKGLNIGGSLTLGFDTADDAHVLKNWSMILIPINETALWGRPTETHETISGEVTEENFVPARYDGTFAADIVPALGHPADTFLRLDAEQDGWLKGVVLVNGRNLGRYYSRHSSQVTMYVPGVWLRPSPEPNYITLFESDYSNCECAPRNPACKCQVVLVAEPMLDKRLP